LGVEIIGPVLGTDDLVFGRKGKKSNQIKEQNQQMCQTLNDTMHGLTLLIVEKNLPQKGTKKYRPYNPAMKLFLKNSFINPYS